MFRPMRRFKQQLPEDEALDVLKHAKRGVLSVTGDDGWPYGVWLNPYYHETDGRIGVWLNPYYHETDGRIYFHGSKEGHKIDALRKDSRASFTVIDDGVRDEGGWAYTFRSVVVFGRVEFVEDKAEEDIEKEIQMAAARVQMLCLIPEHITGKRIHEA